MEQMVGAAIITRAEGCYLAVVAVVHVDSIRGAGEEHHRITATATIAYLPTYIRGGGRVEG